MTQEYEFFKDFAGVTKADLEMFKCGGKSKMKKKAEGGTKLQKKNFYEYDPHKGETRPPLKRESSQSDLDRIEEEQRKATRAKQQQITEAHKKAGVKNLDDLREYDRKKVEYYKKRPKKNNPLYE